MSLRSLLGGIVNDTPVPLTTRWNAGIGLGAGLFGRNDRTAELKALDATPTLYGVVTKLAQMTSLVEWDLCLKPVNDGDDPVPLSGRDRANAAPMKVWDRPNGHMVRPYFVRGVQQHKDLCGEMWWVLVRFLGVPVEIWPVRPDRMFPVPSTTKFIAGYIYVSPDGEQIPLDVDDVITSFYPCPTDPYRGQGPIGALAKDLAQNDAQAAWNASLYRNSANPGGIIKIGRRLGQNEWEEFVERWRMQHQGVQNAGRVAVLEEGDFTPLSYTQKDMQFVETRGLTRQAVFDTYGFPKFGIGDVDDVNRASAEASMTLMAQTLTVPRLEDMRSMLNVSFLPKFGKLWDRYEFNYRSPIPPDAESERDDLTARASAFESFMRAGVDPAEASEVCGLPPLTVTKPEPQPAPAPPGGPSRVPEKDKPKPEDEDGSE